MGCGYCSSDNSRECYAVQSLHRDQFYIHHCQECGAYFLTPRPTPQQIEQAYSESYYGTKESKFPPFIEGVIDAFRKSRSRRVMRYIASSARILDIGCGNGRFLGYLLERNFEVYGVELPGKAVERAKQIKGLQLKEGPLESEDFPNNHFDAISLWHVFEHLTRPRQTLDIIGSILKPGGYLFLSLPNIQSWQSRLFKGHWLHLDPPKHLFFFEPDRLVTLLDSYGFTLQEKTTFSIEQNPFGIQQSLLNCMCRDRDILFERIKGNQEYPEGYAQWKVILQKIVAVLTAPVFVALAGLESVAGRGGTFEMVFRYQNLETGGHD